MKKATLILSAAWCAAIAVNAQDDHRTRLGLQFSPNMAWVKVDSKSIESDGGSVGFRFGLMGDFPLGQQSNYYFSTGAFLNTLHAKFKFADATGLVGGASYRMDLQYVEVPVTIKLKTDEIGYWTYFGQIGFDAGLRVSAKVEGEDISDGVNVFRGAFIVGGGAEFNFSGKTSAMAGLRYSNGLTDIGDEDDGAAGRVHYLELTLGMFF